MTLTARSRRAVLGGQREPAAKQLLNQIWDTFLDTLGAECVPKLQSGFI